MIGRKFGPYEIVAKIGEGGMGEVYRATDTVLGRAVAIKVLPELFAKFPDRVARFEREAKTLAALNHPHIAQIFGFEQSNGAPVLVMELVEGPTLAERIARGPMALDEALPVALQIADALEAAHAQGIIHRDLKPANIKVRPDGTVKVLDFGLAKALTSDPSVASYEAPLDVTHSPTVPSPSPLTGVGLIVGTAAYMSPEQARGRAVDKRTDIWAFGCVLYEMLTGRRAFGGEDATETVAAIVKTDIDVTRLPAETPAAIRRLLKRVLAKDPRQRMADIADARLEIAEAMSASPDDSRPAAVPVARRRRQLAAVAIGAALLGGIGGFLISRRLPAVAPISPSLPLRFAITLGVDDVLSRTGRRIVAVSPSGAHIAYVANERLYLQSTDQLDATVVRDSDKGGFSGHGRGPFFSADGEWLGYWQNGELRKVPVHGGAPIVICAANNPMGADWTANGTIFFGEGGAGIWRVAAAGGVPEVAIKVAPGEYAHGPELLPDGMSLLFTLKRSSDWDDASIVVQTLGGDDRTVVVPGAREAHYVKTGHLVYARRGTLFGVPFDTRARAVHGSAVPVVEKVGDAGGNSGAAHFAMSEAGLLVYGPATALGPSRVPVWVDRQGQEQRIASVPARAYIYPRLSPDGRKMAVTVQDAQSDIWVFDLQRGTSTRLTFEGDNVRSIWSPDGQRLAIASSRDGASTNLYTIAADGSGAPERLTTAPYPQVPESWTPNTLAYSELTPATGWDIWTMSLSDRKPSVFLSTPFHDGGRTFSPNGEWLAYYSDESGRGEVQVRPFPSREGKFQISSDGGAEPVWARTGRELFYRNGTKLMVVDVALQPTFHASAPRLVFDARYETTLPANFDVSPDGQRFIMLKAVAPTVREAPRLVVVQNWFDELRRRVPRN